MAARSNRRVAALTVAVLAASLAGASAPEAAGAAGCRSTPGLLAGKPVTSLSLPKKASAQVWDTGNLATNLAEVRVAAVTIPAGSLVPRIVAPPTLSALLTPAQLAGSRTVAVLNGSVYQEWEPGVPLKSQIVGGTVRKGNSSPGRGLAVYTKSRTMAIASVTTGGTASVTRGTKALAVIPVGAVNWQSLSRDGLSIYTPAWGWYEHPVGRRTVVLSGGKVIRILSGYDVAADRPDPGQQYLTARPGSRYATALAALRVGDKVKVALVPGGSLDYQKKLRHQKRSAIGRPSGLTGVSATIVEAGKNVWISCTWVSEILRPRSVIGWKKNGDMLLVTISGRAIDDGLRVGGATVHQAGEYLRRLGAVTAVIFDGGNSTTLLVRRKVGGPLQRLDRSGGDSQRAITDALAFDVP